VKHRPFIYYHSTSIDHSLQLHSRLNGFRSSNLVSTIAWLLFHDQSVSDVENQPLMKSLLAFVGP
jgi:hypothetical protein